MRFSRAGSADLQITLLAAVIRLRTFFSLLLLPKYVPAFDTSADLILEEKERWLQGFLRWDALYFERIAKHGYRSEQEYAFMPALPFVMRNFGTMFGLKNYSPARAVLHTSVLATFASVVSVFLFFRSVVPLFPFVRGAQYP